MRTIYARWFCSLVFIISVLTGCGPAMVPAVPTPTTAVATVMPTATVGVTATATISPTATATATISPTATATATTTPTATATATISPTATATATISPTATATATISPTATATATTTPTVTATPTPTMTMTVTSTATPTTTADIVQQAYFYRPPHDGTTARDIARNAGLVILTMTDEPFREELREEGYDGLVLQYLLAAELDGPTTAITETAICNADHKPWPNQVAYQTGDFCGLVHPQESWFLHNGKGERLYGVQKDSSDRFFYHMNPASEGWRRFFIQRARILVKGSEEQASLGYDGIFLDNVDASLFKAMHLQENSDGVVREFDSEEAYHEAWVEFLRAVSDEFRPQWPVWANIIADPLTEEWQWKPYLAYLDGVMIESFATGWVWANDPHTLAEWERNLVQAEMILDMDTGYLAVGQGFTSEDETLQQFALASYLLIADGENAFFRYAQESYYEEWLQYENYEVDLGQPLGSRYQLENGRWRRVFRNGVVTVDPSMRRGGIQLFDRLDQEQ